MNIDILITNHFNILKQHLRVTNMKYKNILNTAFLLFLGLTSIQAQETTTTSGGNSTGVGGTVSYTIGQVIYITNIGSNGSVAQGVQQPYEISVVSGIENGEGINLNCSAYPNPTTDFLTLKVENYKADNLSYKLYDISGKLLENKKIEGNETSIAMNNFLPSIYFLRVIDNNMEVKTFKIIKK